MTEIGTGNPDYTISMPGREGSVVRLAWSASTDVGKRRAANEDSYVARSPLFAVADGMGGHSAGDLASAAVVERLAEILTGDFLTPQRITAALVRATADITEISADSVLGVGTTVTGIALTLQDATPYFAVFNIGDSRVYCFDHNGLFQVTVDHSVVQELVEAGAITKAEAEHHPDSNVITRAVGFSVKPVPDVWMVELSAGLRFLVCSDGLTKEVSDESIRMHLAAGLTPESTSGALIDAALASGGRDNVTAIVIDVLEVPEPGEIEDTQPRGKRS
jgi:serine/threonine protein phosphatase PrpC